MISLFARSIALKLSTAPQRVTPFGAEGKSSQSLVMLVNHCVTAASRDQPAVDREGGEASMCESNGQIGPEQHAVEPGVHGTGMTTTASGSLCGPV